MHDLLRDQAGVVARSQLLDLGLRPHDIARLLRQRRLSPVHPGVFVDHTGRPTWTQLAWAAVLVCRHQNAGAEESSALAGEACLRATEGAEGPTAVPIEVVVHTARRLRPPDGIRIVRSAQTLARVRWHLAPPRVPYEHAVATVASRRRRMVDVVAELARPVGARRTTPARVAAYVESLPRLQRRAELLSVLHDLGSGTCSALEHGYFTRVERAHGLPAANRQERGRSRTGLVYRDATYGAQIVELDGRGWHDSLEQRDRDADRDLLAAVSGRSTVRLSWGQVFDRPCWTARQVAHLLGVSPRRCGPGCAVQAQ